MARGDEAPSSGSGRRRKRRKRPQPSTTDRSEQLERELTEVARRLHGELFGFGMPLPSDVPLQLDLRLDLQAGALHSDQGPLRDLLIRALQHHAAQQDAYRPGHIHCFWCDSSSCEHAQPPRPEAVFAGYTPTGAPVWRTFAQVLIDARVPEVDDLFGERPRVLALFQPGRELKGRQLHPFGRASKSYDLLAQLVVGYFSSSRLTSDDSRIAVTLQAIEGRRPDGGPRVRLNLVGRTSDGQSAEDFFSEAPDHWFRRALKAARHRAREIEEALDRLPRDAPRSRRSEILSRVPSVLKEVRRAVEQSERQRSRRTQHAEARRRSSRPTPSALRDAWRANDEEILADERRGTLIFLGPRGRAHAFTPDGRHVTSIRLDGDTLERRLHRRRWRPATEDEIRTVRAALPAPLPS